MTIDHQAIRDAQAGPRDDPREFIWPTVRTTTEPARRPTPQTLRRQQRAKVWEVQDKGWLQHAACNGMNPDIWFPEKGNTKDADLAKEICMGCPVRDDCLADAMIRGEEFGIWGGVSQRGREQLRRDNVPKPIYGCGTSVGFAAHIDAGETPCSGCNKAEKTRIRSAEYAKQGRFKR
jgi:hypothetical protein